MHRVFFKDGAYLDATEVVADGGAFHLTTPDATAVVPGYDIRGVWVPDEDHKPPTSCAGLYQRLGRRLRSHSQHETPAVALADGTGATVDESPTSDPDPERDEPRTSDEDADEPDTDTDADEPAEGSRPSGNVSAAVRRYLAGFGLDTDKWRFVNFPDSTTVCVEPQNAGEITVEEYDTFLKATDASPHRWTKRADDKPGRQIEYAEVPGLAEDE